MRNRKFNNKRGGFKCGRNSETAKNMSLSKCNKNLMPPQQKVGYIPGATSPAENSFKWFTNKQNNITEIANYSGGSRGGGSCCSSVSPGTVVTVPTMHTPGPSVSSPATNHNSTIHTIAKSTLASNVQSSCDAPCNGTWPKHCRQSYKAFGGSRKKSKRKKSKRKKSKRKKSKSKRKN